MRLHTYPEEFRELITVVANDKHISESAVERDYYIVMMLRALADSPYADQCVFKGGTSLSKCYPGSIDRFSEDIDLNIETETKPSESKRKQLKSSIISVIDKLGFTLTNPENVKKIFKNPLTNLIKYSII